MPRGKLTWDEDATFPIHSFLRQYWDPQGAHMVEVLWEGIWDPSVIRTWEPASQVLPGNSSLLKDLKRRCAASASDRTRPSSPQPTEIGLVDAMQLLRSHRQTVVFSGAGISVSAGIPTFADSQLKRSDFQASTVDHDTFQIDMTDLWHLTQQAKPTPFHALLEEQSSIVLHITQNIDCLERSLPAAERKTVRLHGCLDTVRCNICPSDHRWLRTDDDAPEPGSPCTKCEADASRRRANGQRVRNVKSRVEADVRRYDETAKEIPDISHIAGGGGGLKNFDSILVVGTAATIPNVQAMIAKLSHAVHERGDGGVVIWVGPKAPSSSRAARLGLDYWLCVEADRFAEEYGRIGRRQKPLRAK
ncbi:hypothetical protein MCOR25_002205 [Pyricularia grisea]|nr:hypothetical protein MCOR25_002205 [Pyricularia grisea]